ncbi:hypothetical protein PG995_012145 [Apiospora arundinis]
MPTTIPDPNSTGPLPRRPMDPGEWMAIQRTRRRQQEEDEYRDDQRRWATVQLYYTQARPSHQPSDWPIVRQQRLAHERAMAHSWNYWDKHFFMSCVRWVYDTFTVLRDMYHVMPFPWFVRTCCQFFFHALCRGLQLRVQSLDRDIRWVAHYIGMGLQWVHSFLCIVVFSAVWILLVTIHVSHRLWAVALVASRNDEVRSVTGSLFRGFLSCCLAFWSLYFALKALVYAYGEILPAMLGS